MRTWLILDCDFLCHRALYSMDWMHHKENATGVTYGFFRDVINLKRFFHTNHIVFCWDSKHSIRKDIEPTYKANRKKRQLEMSDEEKGSFLGFCKQRKEIRKRYLPKIGLVNNFQHRGYEADDLIAAICKGSVRMSDHIIIVTADQDMYQLLNNYTSIWIPTKRRLITKQKFISHYHIQPDRWAEVKALAGCSSDSIQGVKGIGEQTAIKFLMGDLKKTSKKYQAIMKADENGQIYDTLKLVGLPLVGVKTPQLMEDKLSRKEWNKMCKKLGFTSLRRDFDKLKRKERHHE